MVLNPSSPCGRRRPSAIVVMVATAALLSLSRTPAALAQAPASTASSASTVMLPSLAPLVKRVLPAVVNISVSEKAGPISDQDDEHDQANPFPNLPPFDQFLRRFFGPEGPGGMSPFGQEEPMPQGHRIALGSGFIIDPGGYVVTNNHVVANAEKVTVIFQDGTRHTAKVVGRDPKTDLALLKIEVDHALPYVTWGDSDKAELGDWVLAIGNPFGLGGTVSSGIISARGRDINSGPYDDYLQLDAAINRGNSGGPTFNLEGQVIGVNTAIYSPNGGSVGIAFAIPSDIAKPIIAQLKEHGKVERGWIGVTIQQVTPAIAKSLGLPKLEGALVSEVMPDGPAAKAGVKQGDVILSFDGHAVGRMHDLPLIVAETPIGETAKVTVWRQGSRQQLSPVVAKMPANPQLVENGGSATVAGLTLAPLTPAQQQRLQVPSSVQGVVVAGVADDSPLAELGLQQGDVIEQVNQQPVTTPEQAVAAIEQARQQKGPDKQILMLLNRHGVDEFVAMSVEDAGAG